MKGDKKDDLGEEGGVTEDWGHLPSLLVTPHEVTKTEKGKKKKSQEGEAGSPLEEETRVFSLTLRSNLSFRI